MSSDAHRIQPAEVVRKLLRENGWRLLSAEQLVEDLLQQPAMEQAPPEQLRILAIKRYCTLALHPACLGSLGDEARQRGFEELWNHLHRMAGAARLPITPDHVQEAVVDLLTKAGACRKPEQFLNFAVKRMYDIARRPFRRVIKEQSLDEALEANPYGELEGGANVVGTTPDSTEQSVVVAALRTQLHERFQMLRQSQPRATRQLEAAWLRYMQRLSIDECAEKLETSVSNASVLVTRGLNQFRQDEEFMRLVQEIAASYQEAT
jgi:RNA polymerase sigma factor (sigma-70 family)